MPAPPFALDFPSVKLEPERMTRRSDALTVALTGQLPFIIVIAAVLAFIASFLLLHLYRRRVIKSMRRRSSSALLETKGYLPPEPEHKPNDTPLSFHFAERPMSGPHRDAEKLYFSARRRRWISALIHTFAGACFAATMTSAFLSAGKMDFAPFRFAFLTWINIWPALIGIDLIVGASRRSRLFGLIGYFVIGVIIAAVVLVKNPALPVGQLLYLWFDLNGIPTLLLLIFLNRRIRALGPLLLVFMIVGVAGATLATSIVGSKTKLLKAVAEFSFSIGLSATGMMIGLHVIGFVAGAVFGWLILEMLRQLYESKRISEQSITVDAIWLLFGIVNSIGLVFEGYRWFASGVVAFAIYKLAVAGLFGLVGISRRASRNGKRLLLLRVFALGKRSERLYDSLGKSWRNVGSIQMIAGPDLAATTIEPHEFLDFVSGKLDRRFIDNGRTLDLRIGQMDLAPDREGQFRVTEFFCHDDTWKMTLARLADDCDAVLMDLRGFSQANAGCVFEIHEIFNVVPLARAVFAIDNSTDQAFLRQTMEQAWQQLKDRSPNRHLTAGEITLVQLTDAGGVGVQDLLYAICNAVTLGSAGPPPFRS
jgi:hypothetical protein